MKQVLPILIVVLALVGLLDSAYLSLSHYGYINAQSTIPQDMCQLKSNTCGQVLHSQESSVFGIPSSLIGLGYYAVLFGVAMTKVVTGRWVAPGLLMTLIVGALVFSGYLVYVMVFKIRQACPYCITAHGINAALALLFAASARL